MCINSILSLCDDYIFSFFPSKINFETTSIGSCLSAAKNTKASPFTYFKADLIDFHDPIF